MAVESKPSVRVAANEAERREALELVLRPLADNARGPLLDSLASVSGQGLGPLSALFIATENDRIAAATWAQPSAGRVAALWAPEWSGRRPVGAVTVESALLEATTRCCDAARVSMTQVLFETGDDPRLAAIRRAGFDKIAELEYLGRTVGPATTTNAAVGELNFEPYHDRHHARLKRLLQRTYVGSLDCPGLDGFRDTDDVLTGYRATGRFDPAYWLFASGTDGSDLGVVLVSEHPDAEQAELIYMGLTPEARGRGLGHQLVQRALDSARAMGVDHLMVAVDRANSPAVLVYKRFGFARWAERFVYVRARPTA